MQESKQNWFQIGTPQCGILCGLIGVLVALCFLFFGFWGTLLIVALFIVGYAVGAYGKKPEAQTETPADNEEDK